MTDIKEINNALKSFLQIGYKKLDRLSIVNLIIIFCCFLFVFVASIGDGVETLIYVSGDVAGQLLLGKHVHQNIDSTPIWVYLVFLLAGLVFCTFLVKKHIDGKLW